MEYQQRIDFEASMLKERAMKMAEVKANNELIGWSDRFYYFLIEYAKKGQPFMAEDVRAEAAKKFKMPENNRAIGGIIARAARHNIIKSLGKKNVRNAKAHMANAEIWIINPEFTKNSKHKI